MANATVVTATASFSLINTDITDYPGAGLSVTPFIPGTTIGGNFVPVNAILDSVQITYQMKISGTYTVTNTNIAGGSDETIKGTTHSQGFLYLFTPTSNTCTQSCLGASAATDDIFGGAGPNPSFTQSSGTVLHPGQTSGVQSYSNKQDTVSSDLYTSGSSLYRGVSIYSAVQSPWKVYFSTFSEAGTFVTGGNNASAAFTNQALGLVSVDYTYHLGVPTPEPATITLMGSAILGLAVWRRRRTQK
jgi:hypothetical protein